MTEKKKILIVDDEPNIVMSLEFAFRKKGMEVYIARDGKEAIFLAEKHIPDAMILDIMMPEIDGYQTIKSIKKNPLTEGIHVVFLSAKSKEEDIEKGLSLGAEAYFTKPFSVKKLINEINTLIQN